MTFVYLIHKVNSCSVTPSGFKERIDLIHDIIRGIKKSFLLIELFMDGFCKVVLCWSLGMVSAQKAPVSIKTFTLKFLHRGICHDG